METDEPKVSKVMQNLGEQTCLLCQKSTQDDNFKLIENVTVQSLDVEIQDNRLKMCNNCAEKLHAAFDFKSICLCTEDSLCAYVDLGLETVDLKEIYMAENETSLSDDENICRLCMKAMKEYIPIGELQADMFQEYIPEMNLDISKDPVTCKSCLSNLISHSGFMKSFNVIKRLNTIEEKETNRKAYVFYMKLRGMSEGDRYDKEIKIEAEENESFGNIGEVPLIKIEEIEVKSENIEEESSQSRVVDETFRTDTGAIAAPEHVSAVEEDVKSFKTIEWFKCDVCDYTTKHKHHLKPHMLIHKDASEIQWHYCTSCSDKFKRKDTLKKHMLLHRVPSDIKWHECNICDYKAARKFQLADHILSRHRGPLDKSCLKCDWCDSKFTYKRNLVRHIMLLHKDAYEIAYSCYVCDYKAKGKNSLKKHMQTHTADLHSQILWYKCDVCDYKSEHKSYLKKHVIIHKGGSDVEWFKCDTCDFKSKYSHSLIRHKLIHMQNSQIRVPLNLDTEVI